MAIKTRLQAHGFVQMVTTRNLPAVKKPDGTTREAMTFVNVLIIGDGTICDATVGRDVAVPTEGQEVHALVEVDVFRQDDAVTIIRYLDGYGTGDKK